MNILDHYKQSHDLRASEDYEVSINDQGARLGTPAPVEGRFFYPEGDAPRPQYEGDMLERTGQALEDVGQTAKSMAVGAGAGMAGLPGDVVSLTGGLARLLFPGDEGRIQGATDTITKISEAIGSERFLGLYRDLVNESDMSAEDKQMALDAAETGSFFSLPGAVPVAQAAKRGAKAFAAGAPARVAERQSGTTLASGVDPTAMIDDIIMAQARYFETGKFEPPTAENPVSVVKPTEQEPGIIAFHGSGADFDEFRLEMVGTGEGAQAYGYGLYFTDSEDIAKFYKEAMVARQEFMGGPIKYKGRKFAEFEDSAAAEAEPLKYQMIGELGKEIQRLSFSPVLRQPAKAKQQLLASIDEQIEQQRAAFKNESNSVKETMEQTFVSPLIEKREALEKIDPADIELDLPEGKMYKVGLAPKPDELLDYDKSLRQQPKFAEALKSLYEEYGVAETADIGTLFETIKNQRGISAESLSDRLSKAGIPGIKYRAAGSRGAATADEAAERNYVIFDDKAVKILEKYGIVGPVAVTAGAASQTDTEADDGKTT